MHRWIGVLFLLLAELAVIDAKSHGDVMRLARMRRHTSRNATSAAQHKNSTHHATHHSDSTRHHSNSTEHRSNSTKHAKSGQCKVTLSAANVQQWEQVNAKAIKECADKAASSSSGMAVCHSTAYIDRSRKLYGGAVHVMQVGGHEKNSTRKGSNATHTEHKDEHKHTKRSSGSYSIRLSTSSGDLIESGSFRLAELHAKCNPCSSDNITRPSFEVGHLSLLASMHYNAAFESDSDLAPSAVVIADEGAKSGGSADLIHLGNLGDFKAPWGLFLGMPAASKISKRAAYSSETTTGKSCSANTTDARSTKKKDTKKGKSRAKTASAAAVSHMTDDSTCHVVSEGKSKAASKSVESKTSSTSSAPVAAQPATQSPAAAAAGNPTTGSVANAAAAAASPAAAAAGTTSAAATDPNASTAQDTAADPTASDAPQSLQVVPIGVGVFAGASLISIAIVAVVHFERRKYRRQQRSQSIGQQLLHATTLSGTREVRRV